MESDQRLWEMTALKNLTASIPHLQRMLLCLQQYDAMIKYRPVTEIQLPDALSRFSYIRPRNEISLDM